MYKLHSGFTLIQIILSILAGTIILAGVVGGVLYFAKSELPEEQQNKIQQQGRCGDGVCDAAEKANKNLCPKDCDVPDIISSEDKIMENSPYYFFAIHNEPHNGEPEEGKKMGPYLASVSKDYEVLKRMIAKADSYNLKLTLMFTAQWADYISQSPERTAELENWKKSGHEISAHHHGLEHGNWDGYTDSSKEEYMERRLKKTRSIEPYNGTLDDFMAVLRKINPEIKSGCVNDEIDKNELPSGIIYDTCSGFANFGSVGTRMGDGTDPKKGINDYISTGVHNDIVRKWLTHSQVTSDILEGDAEEVFLTLDASKVYGAVAHSLAHEEESVNAYLDFLHANDPTGAKSVTVSEVIDEKLLPEKAMTVVQLNAPMPQRSQQGRCGDGVCGPVEKIYPDMCPSDCSIISN